MPDAQSMIERMARAMSIKPDDDSINGLPIWTVYEPTVRAVLNAMRESSANMSFAGAMAAVPHGLNMGNGQAQDIWQAMIDAALEDGR